MQKGTLMVSDLRIGCVLMASGRGKRFGGNKLLATYKGRTLFSCACAIAASVPFSKICVITRHPEIAALCQKRALPFILHDRTDRNEMVALGVSTLLSDTNDVQDISLLDGILFLPCDQPCIHPASMKRLCTAFSEQPNYICRLSYTNTSGETIPGSPVLFPQQFFLELQHLPQKKGGSFLAKKYPLQVTYVPAEDPLELFDIDTPEDLSRLP